MGDGQGHQAKPEEVHEHRDCWSAFVETVECYRVEKHQPAEENHCVARNVYIEERREDNDLLRVDHLP